VGRPDPRYIVGTNRIDTRITRQLKSYAKEDAPPVRVKPIPIAVLHTASSIALNAGDANSLALLDLLWIAFFFLLRPGEYLQPAADSHPIRLQDTRLWCHSVHIDSYSCDPQQLLSATFVSLTLDRQKNGRRGEPVGHGKSGKSGHPVACPVLADARRIIYLRSQNAPSVTPLCALGPSFTCMVPAQLTLLLRTAVAHIPTPLGISPTDINAKSLRSTGAMALLNQKVDTNRIRLLGRWQSDAMFHYLHVQAHDLMSDYSSIMLQGGDFTLIPNFPSALPTSSNHQLFDQLAFPFTNLFMSSYQKKYFFPLTPASLPSCQRCVPFLSRWAQMGSAASYQTYGAVSVSNGARPASYHWSPAGDYMGSRAPGTLVNGQLTPKLLSYTMSATHPSDVW
jgi:hypothetical protein